MTNTTTRSPHAPHADGLAIFNGVLGALEAVGWRRHNADTLRREGTATQIRHQFSAGCWELHHELVDRDLRSDGDRLCAKIDLRRPPLPTVTDVMMQLFGGVA